MWLECDDDNFWFTSNYSLSMVKAFAWGRSETLWKLRHGFWIRYLLNYLHGSLAVLRSKYLISRANTRISSISCNLKVRYCLIRSRHQLLSQAITLHFIFKLCFRFILSFTTGSVTLLLQTWKGCVRKYQKHYPLFYATFSVFLSFCPSIPRTLFTHTNGTKNFLSYMW